MLEPGDGAGWQRQLMHESFGICFKKWKCEVESSRPGGHFPNPILAYWGTPKKASTIYKWWDVLGNFYYFQQKGKRKFRKSCSTRSPPKSPFLNVCACPPHFKSVVIPGGGSYMFTVFLATFLGSGLSWLFYQSEDDGPKSPCWS